MFRRLVVASGRCCSLLVGFKLSIICNVLSFGFVFTLSCLPSENFYCVASLCHLSDLLRYVLSSNYIRQANKHFQPHI